MKRTGIAVIIISLAIISAAAYGVFRFYGYSYGVKEKVEIAVYLDPAADTAALKAGIGGLPEVKSVIFISRQDALQVFRKEMGDTDIFSALPSNPLPDAFVVKLRGKYAVPENFEKICSRVRPLEGVTDVRYEKKFSDRIFPMIELAEKIALICGLVVAGYAGFMIIAAVILGSERGF